MRDWLEEVTEAPPMRLLVAAVCLSPLLMSQKTLQEQLQPRYAEAIHALNAGRLADAKSLLERLLTDCT